MPSTSVLTHAFDSPPEAVFRAWTERDLFQKWFLPTGFTCALCEVEPKPGGVFRIHMQAPDGTVYPTQGRYTEIDAPHWLEYVDRWDDDRAENPPIQVTVQFASTDDGTLLTMTSLFTSKEHRDRVLAQGGEEGMKMFFGNLERLLAGQV